MAKGFAAGFANGIDGRAVCIQAIDRALDQLGADREPVKLAVIIASQEFSMQDVVSGATALLGDSAVVGISSAGLLAPDGVQDQAVSAALFSGNGLHAAGAWMGDALEETGEDLPPSFIIPDEAEGQVGAVFFFGGAGQGNAISALEAAGLPVLGALSAGGPANEVVYQFFGDSGSGKGAAAALLAGNFQLGVGLEHGWIPVGLTFHISEVDGARLKLIDQTPPAQFYSRLFGQPADHWHRPPLRDLVRLYPFGVEQSGGPLLVRSPLFVEEDGSFVMTAPVRAGQTGHLLVGSAAECRKAAGRATASALEQLGESKPRLALVFADLSWKMLSEIQPFNVYAVVKEALGTDIPIAGGFTAGQVCSGAGGSDSIFNQQIEVVLFGE